MFFWSVFGLLICLCVFVFLIACLMILFKFYRRNVFTHLLTWNWHPMFQISYAVIKSTLLITTVFFLFEIKVDMIFSSVTNNLNKEKKYTNFVTFGRLCICMFSFYIFFFILCAIHKEFES